MIDYIQYRDFIFIVLLAFGAMTSITPLFLIPVLAENKNTPETIHKRNQNIAIGLMFSILLFTVTIFVGFENDLSPINHYQDQVKEITQYDHLTYIGQMDESDKFVYYAGTRTNKDGYDVIQCLRSMTATPAIQSCRVIGNNLIESK